MENLPEHFQEIFLEVCPRQNRRQNFDQKSKFLIKKNEKLCPKLRHPIFNSIDRSGSSRNNSGWKLSISRYFGSTFRFRN